MGFLASVSKRIDSVVLAKTNHATKTSLTSIESLKHNFILKSPTAWYKQMGSGYKREHYPQLIKKGHFLIGIAQNGINLARDSLVTLTPPNTITTGSTSFPAGGCTELAMMRDCTWNRWPTFSYALKTVSK